MLEFKSGLLESVALLDLLLRSNHLRKAFPTTNSPLSPWKEWITMKSSQARSRRRVDILMRCQVPSPWTESLGCICVRS